APATGGLSGSALVLARLRGLARGHVRLKTLDIAPGKGIDRAPAEQGLDVALNAAAVQRQRGRLDPSLRVGEVKVAQFGHRDRLARSMTVGGRVGALSYLFEPVGGQLARLVRRQFSDAAERKPARPAFLIPVLHDKRRNAARLHSHAETL